MDIVTVILFLLTFYLVAWYLSVPSNLPPGPSRWPILGSLPWKAFVGGTKFDRMGWYQSLHQTYGDIVTMWLSGMPVFYVYRHALIREALINQAKVLSERNPIHQAFRDTVFDHGIINSMEWHSQRRAALSSLRDFGAGASSLEGKILMECDALCSEIKTFKEEPFDPRDVVTKAVSNIICSIIFGKRYNYDDPVFCDAMRNINGLFSNNFIPTWMYIVPFVPTMAKRMGFSVESSDLTNTIGFIRNEVDAHRGTFDAEHPRDFIDLYLQSEVSTSEDKDKAETPQDPLLPDDAPSVPKSVTEQKLFISNNEAKRLLGSILDLFLAGTETTSTTLRWLFVYMMKYPDVREKCRQEIVEVVGSSRPPQMSDRLKLPYTEAMLLELQRCANIAPRALPHSSRTPVTFGGYDIPANAMVILQLYSSHMDPEVWVDPEVFRPERWIKDGKVEADHVAFMPFSLGRRRCLGEQIAKMEMFLFTVTLLQQFNFRAVGDIPPLRGHCGLTHYPAPFSMQATQITMTS